MTKEEYGIKQTLNLHSQAQSPNPNSQVLIENNKCKKLLVTCHQHLLTITKVGRWRSVHFIILQKIFNFMIDLTQLFCLVLRIQFTELALMSQINSTPLSFFEHCHGTLWAICYQVQHPFENFQILGVLTSQMMINGTQNLLQK